MFCIHGVAVSGFTTAPLLSQQKVSERSSSYLYASRPERLSQEDQAELLKQAVEARFLKAKEKELAMMSPKLQI